MTIEEINRNINAVTKKMALKKHITSHKFRDTHVSLLAQAGVSLEVIQERIGHGDERVTKQIYLHVTPDQKTDAVSSLDNLFKKTGSKKGQNK